jgi:hypothetical protein
MNGVSSKTIHCRRGVRQGDHISPLLFVLAADLLLSILNKAKNLGVLHLPIPLSFSINFPVIHYVDDTLIIMEGMPNSSSSSNLSSIPSLNPLA